MRLLLDTHLLLWTALESKRVSSDARALIDDFDNALLFSAVSIWEIAIKRALGRPAFQINPTALRGNLLGIGYHEVALTSDHGIGVATLPLIHKDPFDRILIAQAAVEEATLLTSDRTIARYPGAIRLV